MLFAVSWDTVGIIYSNYYIPCYNLCLLTVIPIYHNTYSVFILSIPYANAPHLTILPQFRIPAHLFRVYYLLYSVFIPYPIATSRIVKWHP